MAILDDAAHFLDLNGLCGFHRTVTEPARTLPVSERQRQPSSQVPRLLVWSALDQHGTQRLLDIYRPFLLQDHSHDTEGIAHALGTKRSIFPWRSFAVMDPQYHVPVEFAPSKPMRAKSHVRIAFAFTGQGSQYSGMGRELMDFDAFVESIHLSGEHLKALGCSWSLQDVISTGRHGAFDLDDPEYSQTVTTCLQIALVDLLQSFEIVPSVVLGHSSGEVAASYACGALSRESAISVSYHRGILSGRLAKTLEELDLSMMVVGLSRDGIGSYLDRLAQESEEAPSNVRLGCVNSPRSVTLSGPWSQLSRIEDWLKIDDVFARRLRVPISYHHPEVMSKISCEYLAAIGRSLKPGIQRRSEVPRMISSVTGDVADHAMLASGQYWDRNLTSTVEFEKAVSRLATHAHKVPRQRLGRKPEADLRATHILEVGPHSVLQGPIKDCILGLRLPPELPSLSYLPLLIRNKNSAHTVLHAAGSLWCAGLSDMNTLRLNRLIGATHPLPYDLPAYPFNHTKSYWLEGRLSKNLRLRDTPRHDLLGTRSLDWNSKLAQWRNVIRLAEVPWLHDHRIGEQIVLPAAGMLVMAIEALKQLSVGPRQPVFFESVHISHVVFSHAIAIPTGRAEVEIQFNLSSPPPGQQDAASHFRLFAIENGSYIECCAGAIRAIVESQDSARIMCMSSPGMEEGSAGTWLNQITEACREPVKDLYSGQKATSIFYGPCFQNLENPRLGSSGEAAALLNTEAWATDPVTGLQDQYYTIHPSTLDGLAQLLFPAMNRAWEDTNSKTMMPTRIDSLWIQDSPAIRQGKLEVAGLFRPRGLRGAYGDIVATVRDSKRPLIIIRGLETTILAAEDNDATRQALSEPPRLCHRIISKPHVPWLNADQLLACCTSDRPDQAEDAVMNSYWKTAVTMCFIHEALRHTQSHEPVQDAHLLEYIQWMKRQKTLCQDGSTLVSEKTVLDLLADHADRKRLEQHIETSDAEGALLVTLGRKLVDVFSGVLDALDLMFRGELLNLYYHEMIANDHDSYPACQFVDLMSHQNSSMKILEVGAGTGAITSRLLDTLSSNGMLNIGVFAR